ncbi:MAG: hypothetical protein R2824_07595 [Saprospiraceae bacterium]
MKTPTLLMIFVVLSAICFGQEIQKTRVHIESIYLEPHIGINRVESLMESSRYFNNYHASGKVSPYFGIDAVFRFRSNLLFQTGLRYMEHNTGTDSLNIPPVGRDDIWSAFTCEYKSINIPIKLGYQLRLAGNSIVLRPQFGIALRFLGGHQYSESVNTPDIPFNPGSIAIPPAEVYDFEKFGIGVEGGLVLILFNNQKISPFVSANYFRSSTIFKLIRGYESNLSDSHQIGAIREKGFLLSVGANFGL